MNTTLAKTLELEKESDYLDFPIDDIVKAASLVIVPLGPIDTFAARNPWVGMEGQSFEQVARRFKETCDVDLYPNDSMLQSARKRGEINLDYLEKRLHHWLDLQSLEMPRDEAERFCRAALMLEDQSFKQLAVPELKSLAKKLNRFTYQITEKHSIQTYSQRLEELVVRLWHKSLITRSSSGVNCSWMSPKLCGLCQIVKKVSIKLGGNLSIMTESLNHNIRKQLKNLPEDADACFNRSIVGTRNPLFRDRRIFRSSFTCLARLGRHDALALTAINWGKFTAN